MVIFNILIFFLSACFSDWFKHTCCFERCVCISLEFFPPFSDDVVTSLGLCLLHCEKYPGSEPLGEKEKNNNLVQEYGKL